MSSFRRYYQPGGAYFFTLVTYRRRPILCSPVCRQILRDAIERVRKKWPFEVVAICLLPDHLHTVLLLPTEDRDYSLRWRRIKEEFTRAFLQEGGKSLPQSASRIRQQYQGVWQKRFWEHLCTSEDDVKRCVDYIHWNPRKHGLVQQIGEWQWSSFHKYVRMGEYEAHWGDVDPAPQVCTEGWD